LFLFFGFAELVSRAEWRGKEAPTDEFLLDAAVDKTPALKEPSPSREFVGRNWGV
jgi:hypothetical protein